MATTDCETGEYVSHTYMPEPKWTEFDLETGEPDSGKTPAPKRRPKFVIPKELIQQKEKENKCCIDPIDNYSLFKKEQIMGLQEVTKCETYNFFTNIYLVF